MIIEREISKEAMAVVDKIKKCIKYEPLVRDKKSINYYTGISDNAIAELELLGVKVEFVGTNQYIVKWDF